LAATAATAARDARADAARPYNHRFFRRGPRAGTRPDAMPIYAYRCEQCGHVQDVMQKLADAPLTVCPSCGADAFRKQLTAPAFQLKGSGWYVTDFRDGNKGKPGKADDAPADATKADAAKGDAAKEGDAGKGDAGTAGAKAAGTGTGAAAGTAPASGSGAGVGSGGGAGTPAAGGKAA
jgi:putative FmdB family regulatory protein